MQNCLLRLYLMHTLLSRWHACLGSLIKPILPPSKPKRPHVVTWNDSLIIIHIKFLILINFLSGFNYNLYKIYCQLTVLSLTKFFIFIIYFIIPSNYIPILKIIFSFYSFTYINKMVIIFYNYPYNIFINFIFLCHSL